MTPDNDLQVVIAGPKLPGEARQSILKTVALAEQERRFQPRSMKADHDKR